MEPERAEQVILNVGRRISEIREELGWTQQQAAEKLRMPVNNLQRMEMGMNLTIRTLVRMAKGFGVPTEIRPHQHVTNLKSSGSHVSTHDVLGAGTAEN